MITADEALQGLRAQVSKAGVHKPVRATGLPDNEKNDEGLEIGPLKKPFQAGAPVLVSAVEEDPANR